MDYKEYYEKQIGSGMTVFRGSRNQKGMGLGNIFRSFVKWAVPMFKTHALPALKSSVQTIGTEAVKAAANAATEAIAGKSESCESPELHCQKNVQYGSGYNTEFKKTKPLINKKIKNKRRRVQDIFD